MGFPTGDSPRNGVFLFAEPSGYDAGTANFNITERAGNYALIEVTAMDDNRKEDVPMAIWLNGERIWEGPSPFSRQEPNSYVWVLQDPWMLTGGLNVLSISNTSAGGGFGELSWLFVQKATVYY